jgi:hypothetical protein
MIAKEDGTNTDTSIQFSFFFDKSGSVPVSPGRKKILTGKTTKSGKKWSVVTHYFR